MRPSFTKEWHRGDWMTVTPSFAKVPCGWTWMDGVSVGRSTLPFQPHTQGPVYGGVVTMWVSLPPSAAEQPEQRNSIP